jgi:RsiW-degrading membrane proteinase PrsW (M82 family)
MAAIISIYSGYIARSFLPPFIWLLFYLHEDRHPEPKRLLVLTFVAGIVVAFAAVALELGLFGTPPVFSGLVHRLFPGILTVPLVIFSGVSLIEEYLKYAAVKVVVFRRPEFDEPIDAMIYMMTSALGFAAIENALFLLPVFHESIFAGLEITTGRFLGANLLHALTSGIVGFFLARAWFHPKRTHFIAIGITLAALLHTGFNYFILEQDSLPQATLYLVLLLSFMAIMVLIDFERLKKKSEPAP